MCVASRYLNQIEIILEQVKEDMEKLRNKLSEYDKNISEINHKIEIEKFNACEGYYYSKNLKGLLQKRRLVKTEYYRMNMLYTQLLQSLNDKCKSTKSSLKKSKNKGKNWFDQFDITFADIEEEVLH